MSWCSFSNFVPLTFAFFLGGGEKGFLPAAFAHPERTNEPMAATHQRGVAASSAASRKAALPKAAQPSPCWSKACNLRSSRCPWGVGGVLPRKLTWNLKITQLKRKIIFQTSIFGFHVNFRGCNWGSLKISEKTLGKI